jgi:hypothetical protein
LAVLTGVALWFQPAWRATLAVRVMPIVSAAVEAGPARLLAGQAVPRVVRPEETLASTAPGVRPPADDLSGAGAPLSLSVAFKTAGRLAGAPFTMNPAPVAAAPAQAATGAAARNLANVAAFSALITKLDPHPVPSFSVLSALSATPVAQRGAVADSHAERSAALTRQEQLVASYLARRYRVAHQPVNTLVKAAFDTGSDVGLDPLLLLAVMAIESGFNPYAESGVGAQGLMQVMYKVHSDKFEYFGGAGAALQPVANIKVGALVLKDCIEQGGSLPGGLRRYVGATTPDDGGYGAKVLAERSRLHDVVNGRNVPVYGNGPHLVASIKPVVKQRAPVSRNAAPATDEDPAATGDGSARNDDGGDGDTTAAQNDAGAKPSRVSVELGTGA